MRLAFSRCFLFLCITLSVLQIARAEDLSKIRPTGYVTDLAGTLNADTKTKLEALGTELEQKTGAQMAIVTVHAFEGESIENYANDLYKKLGVGGKKDDRGVLLLVSPDERKYRIEVGYGLEPVINDARAGSTGRAMVPFLRAGDYSSAIQTAAWKLANYIADERGVTLSGQPRLRSAPPSRDSRGSSIGVWIFLIALVLIFMAARRGGGGGGGGVGSGLTWLLLGMLSGGGGGGGYRGGGGFGGGGGGYSGGGGFGGFGGGSSGGGGASGSW